MPAQLDADHYRKNSELQTNLAQGLIDELALRGDESILDVGCGDGRNTDLISSLVPQGSVVGLDPSSSMLDLARKSFPHIEFFQGGAEEIEWEDRFDLITTFSALHWVQKPREAFLRMHRALMTGGRVLILTYPKESPYWAAIEGVIYSERWREHAVSQIERLTSKEYNELALSCGFEIVQSETDDAICEHPGKEALKRYAKGWLPCMLPLPKELQDPFVDDLAEALPLQLPYKRLVMKLSR